MNYQIGSLHYVDGSNESRKHASYSRPVIVVHNRNGWRAWTKDKKEEELPAPSREFEHAVRRGRNWIQNLGGTCLKTPKPIKEA